MKCGPGLLGSPRPRQCLKPRHKAAPGRSRVRRQYRRPPELHFVSYVQTYAASRPPASRSSPRRGAAPPAAADSRAGRSDPTWHSPPQAPVAPAPPPRPTRAEAAAAMLPAPGASESESPEELFFPELPSLRVPSRSQARRRWVPSMPQPRCSPPPMLPSLRAPRNCSSRSFRV
ncbi:hypothetical protein M885DRAFT_529362 [Pelagophyceae sp. CCMP2097]|nr:hypothetical protein M885DRAFT_529362 [Pelagophyceae sp. CCMP2097]